MIRRELNMGIQALYSMWFFFLNIFGCHRYVECLCFGGVLLRFTVPLAQTNSVSPTSSTVPAVVLRCSRSGRWARRRPASASCSRSSWATGREKCWWVITAALWHFVGRGYIWRSCVCVRVRVGSGDSSSETEVDQTPVARHAALGLPGVRTQTHTVSSNTPGLFSIIISLSLSLKKMCNFIMLK